MFQSLLQKLVIYVVKCSADLQQDEDRDESIVLNLLREFVISPADVTFTMIKEI